MPKFRPRRSAQKTAKPKVKPELQPAVSLDKPVLKTAATSPKSTWKSWRNLRWPIAAVVALLICGGMKVGADVIHQRAEQARELERAKPKPPAQPLCTRVTLTEVKNPDGSVRGTERAESQVLCVRPATQPYKPFEFPLWARVLFWSFTALYVWLCLRDRNSSSVPFIPWLP